MRRRSLLQSLGALGVAAGLPPGLAFAATDTPISVQSLPALTGELTVYLGQGEGGLYERVMEAIRERNPQLDLRIRRGPTVALANTILAEAKNGVPRADVFWAVDSGSLGLVADAGLARTIPRDLRHQLREGYRYDHWTPISGRIRTLPYNTEKLSSEALGRDLMALPDLELDVGWAPAYGAFQSFVTAMRLLEGDARTLAWLRAIKPRARSFAGELGAVLAVSRGEVDVAFANHYYTLRVKAGQPEAPLALAFTENDAGCLLNASGAMALSDKAGAIDFIRYLLTVEVQQFLAGEAYEIPMVQGLAMPTGLPPLAQIRPPRLDLPRLAAVRPTLDLMRRARVL